MTRRLPNLFIIGAMKAGTSSLHEYLHQHPEIFMSRMKEPQYFAPHLTRWKEAWGMGNPYPEPGIDWYLRLFQEAGDAKYAGESSVSYTARPWVVDCEQRIYEFNPDARLIYLMRDPIERTISHYWHFVRDGREDRDLLSAIKRKPEYITRSNYALQLKPYIDTFGPDQVFALTLEELNAAPHDAFRRLFDWLGIDNQFSVDISHRHNVTSTMVRQTRRFRVFLDTLQKSWRWERIERFVPKFAVRSLAYGTWKHVDRAAADTNPTVDYLRPVMQRYTSELCQLLGREFPEWTTLAPVQIRTADDSKARPGLNQLSGFPDEH